MAANELYATVEMLRVRLSYRDDSDAYLGSLSELWTSAQEQLKTRWLTGSNISSRPGEAAFTGPKFISWLLTPSAANTRWQLSN